MVNIVAIGKHIRRWLVMCSATESEEAMEQPKEEETGWKGNQVAHIVVGLSTSTHRLSPAGVFHFFLISSRKENTLHDP
jgi:hypothetical protein